MRNDLAHRHSYLLHLGCGFRQRATLLAYMRAICSAAVVLLVDGREAAAAQGGVCGKRGIRVLCLCFIEYYSLNMFITFFISCSL